MVPKMPTHSDLESSRKGFGMDPKMAGSLVIRRQEAKAHSRLLVENKRYDRVGTDANQGRNKAAVKGHWTLLGNA